MTAPTPPSDDGAELIFVIGLPYAGTESLAATLGQHADRHAGADPWFMLHLAYLFRWDGIDADYDAFAARRGLELFAPALPHGVDDVFAAIRHAALSLYRAVLTRHNKRVFIDASPRLVRIVPELARLFPAARFVCALRHPASILSAHVESHCDGDIEQLRRDDGHYRDLLHSPALMSAALELLGKRAVRIHYEQWGGDTARLREQLCPHFEIPVPLAAQGQVTNTAAASPPSAHDIAAAVLQRLRGDNPHAPLLQAAQSYLDYLGASTLNTLGYSRSAQGLAVAQLCGDSPGLLLAPLPRTPVAEPLHSTLTTTDAQATAQQLNTDGEALFRESRSDEAIAAFLQATSLAPSYGAPLNNLGALLWQRGQRIQAIAYFASSAATEPAYSNAWLNLCDALSALGQAPAAKTLLTRLLLERPDDADVLRAYVTA